MLDVATPCLRIVFLLLNLSSYRHYLELRPIATVEPHLTVDTAVLSTAENFRLRSCEISDRQRRVLLSSGPTAHCVAAFCVQFGRAWRAETAFVPFVFRKGTHWRNKAVPRSTTH